MCGGKIYRETFGVSSAVSRAFWSKFAFDIWQAGLGQTLLWYEAEGGQSEQ